MIARLYRWIRADSKREFVGLLGLVVLIRTFGFGLYQVPTPSMETTMLVGDRFFADKLTPVFIKPKRGEIISFNDPLYAYSSNPLIRIFEEYFWGPANWTKRVIGQPGDFIDGKIEDGKPVVYINGKKLDEPYINKYPIMLVFKQDIDAFKEAVKKEIQKLDPRQELTDQHYVELYNKIGSNLITRESYDPSKPLSEQPFYRMHENRIYPDNDNKPILSWPSTPLPHDGYPQQRMGNSTWNGTDVFHIELDDHHYWLMGDNRLGSDDSRRWGPLDSKHIHGKIKFRIWSLDSREWSCIIDLLKHPIDIWRRMRWNRFFQWVY